MFMFEFVDDFDPFNVKRSKTSACLKTLSINPHVQKSSSMTTVPIAIGRKGKHEEVEKLHVDDLSNSCDPKEISMFCWGRASTCARAHAEAILLNLDQIGRRPFANFSGGNSSHGALCGHSVRLKEVKSKLVSCSHCFHAMLLDHTRECEVCANWNAYQMFSNVLKT